MPPSEQMFHLVDDDEKKEMDQPVIEPLILIPPAVSSLSLANISFKTKISESISCTSRFSGVIYSLISSFLFTCTIFSIKQLGIDLLDALLLRFFLQSSVTYLFAYHKNYQLLPGNFKQIILQILCCATGAGSFFLYFCAVRYVELSDVTTLSYTRVVWTIVLSIFIYRERPSIYTLIALPLTLLGVIFVAQPTFLFSSTALPSLVLDARLRLIGLSLAIISSVLSASNVLLFKLLISTSKDIKPSVLNLQYCCTVLILLIGYQLNKTFVLHTGLSWQMICSRRYLSASIVCLVMIAVNILTQKAIKREHPAIVTLIGSADIIFSLILQNIFTAKRSNSFALLGSTLVISSVVIIGLSKIMHERHIQKKNQSLLDDETIVKDIPKV